MRDTWCQKILLSLTEALMRPRQIFVAVVSAAGLGTAASQPAVTRSCCLCFLSALLCSLQVTVSAVSACGSQFPAASISRISLPLSFEANQGQTDSRVNFLSRGSEYTLFLTSEEAVLQLRAHAKENDGAVLRMRLLGANQHADARGWDELAGKINYFIGRDPAKWHTNVPTYGKVGYNGVYPGVDLVYYGNQGQLEYDFIVSPWADPNSISIQFDSAAAEIDSAGDLLLQIEGGQVRFHRPVAYQSVLDEQHVGKTKRFIDSRFVLLGTNRITFQLSPYDHSRPIVIDPLLVYSTYLGGSFPDEPLAVAVDSTGAGYVTGLTCSADFPVTAGAYQTTHNGPGGACPTGQNSFEDAFVTKFNKAGSALVYSTYIGGSASDRGYDIAVDPSGNAYIAGQTQSSDYPTTAGAFITTCPGGVGGCNTGTVTKLNSTGSALVYSTYLGGNNNATATGIAVNSSGEAYVTGSTDGTFPTTAGAYQANNPRAGAGLSPVFAVLNATGLLVSIAPSSGVCRAIATTLEAGHSAWQ